MNTLQDYQVALQRIRAKVRHTPLFPAAPLCLNDTGAEIWFKPECFQVTGSFKARGCYNRILSLPEETRKRGVTTASGGNFGAAVAYAARDLAIDAVIYVMNTSTELARSRIRACGFDPQVVGDFWDQSWEAAGRHAARSGATMLHPYADNDVILGQGTIAVEVLADLPEADTLVVSIGGGGLIAGIAEAAKLIKPSIRIVGVEAAGCPTLKTCREKGRIVALENVKTHVPILAARSTEPINFEIIERYVDELIVVDEALIDDCARLMWERGGVAIELGAATAIAATRHKLFAMKPEERVVVVLCGNGIDGLGSN